MNSREWLIIIMAIVLALIYGHQLVKGQDLILKRLTAIEESTTSSSEVLNTVFGLAKDVKK